MGEAFVRVEQRREGCGGRAVETNACDAMERTETRVFMNPRGRVCAGKNGQGDMSFS